MNNNKEIKNSIFYLLIYFMFITSSLFVLMIKGYDFFLWTQMIFCALSLYVNKKLVFTKDIVVNLIYIGLFINAISALTTSMPLSYKKTAVILPIMTIPVYFTAVYLKNMIKSNHRWLGVVKKGIKISLYIQLAWIPLQFVLYKGMHIDINDLIFVKTLHMLSNASFVRAWVWYPSGLSWHSATLAPIFVLGFILCQNIGVRLLIIGESMICGNSTTLIGVTLCAILLFINKIIRNGSYKKIKLINLAAIILILGGLVLAIYKFNLFGTIKDTILNLWNRFFGGEKDASTNAHMGYYTDYFKIVKNSSIIQTLFGYGYGCSGYTITAMYNRYTTLSSWAIESDYINIIVSRGIVGFLIYYYFLLKIMIKGARIDIRYGFFIFVILVQGFGYNIQFDYLFLIELVMYYTIKYNINFFASEKKKLPEGDNSESIGSSVNL